jgi:NADH-quinone oxidoreductase subunit M
MRLGGYLLLRVLVAGEHDGARLLAPIIAVLAAATVAWAALAALRDDDLRRFAAYAALVPGGVFALGLAALTPLSLLGASLQLIAGGLAAALLVGACATVSERAQSRSLAVLGGLAGRMPKLAWLLVLAGFCLIGVPGTATFVAEAFTFFGAFYNQPGAAFVTLAGLAGIAAGFAIVVQRVLFGSPRPDTPGVSDASSGETWYLGLLVAALLWFGILPGGPKIGGQVTLFDAGIVNVLNNSSSDIASTYVPPAPPPPPPPVPIPRPAPSPSPSPEASPSPAS